METRVVWYAARVLFSRSAGGVVSRPVLGVRAMRDWIEDRFELGIAVLFVSVTAISWLLAFVPCVLIGSVAMCFRKQQQGG